MGPGRRDGEAPDPAKGDQIADRRGVRSEIAEAGPVTYPPEPGLPVGDVAKLSGAGRLHGIGRSRAEASDGALSGRTRDGESHD